MHPLWLQPSESSHWESIWNYCTGKAHKVILTAPSPFPKKHALYVKLNVDVANEDNSDAVNDKDMKIIDRNLKKENKKFDKELAGKIATEFVFEDSFLKRCTFCGCSVRTLPLRKHMKLLHWQSPYGYSDSSEFWNI